MATKTWKNINGTWKDISDVQMNIGGTWKDKVMPYINIGGTWKPCMSYGPVSGGFIYSVNSYNGPIIFSKDGGNTTYTSSGLGSNNMAYVSASSPGQSPVCCSSSGNIVYACSYNTSRSSFVLYKSTDYGANFTHLTNSIASTSRNAFSPICSGNGQYVYDSANSRLYRSSDYGETWSDMGAAANSILNCSISGQYVYRLQSGTIYVSSDYGASFSAGGAVGINYVSMCCSDSGQYIYIAGYPGSGIAIAKSSDYGASFSTVFSSSGTTSYQISCSSDGSKIVYAGYRFASSTDYGVSWSNLYNYVTQTTSAHISRDGSTVFIRNQYNNVLRSPMIGMGFDTWTSISFGGVCYIRIGGN